MNETPQLRMTGPNGTVSRQSRKDARWTAQAVMLSREHEEATAFSRRADDIALRYKVPKVIMPFSARSEAHELSKLCKNDTERTILATAFDNLAECHDTGSRERQFLQAVAAEIRPA